MCLLIYLGYFILLAKIGNCDLTWDKVYILLSAKLDKIILDQDVMKQEMKDLVISTTATHQQVISLEKRHSEVASFSQQMVVFQERLDNMDSHVKDVAAAEVGRRTHLLRRGLEQEKAAAQSRSEKIQFQIMKLGQEFEGSMNKTCDLSARVDILNNKHDLIKSEVNVLTDTMHEEFNETWMQISKLEHGMMVALYNSSNLFEMFDSLEKTHIDIKSDIKQASEKTRSQIATVHQEVVTTQRNTQTLQSRVDSFERTQSDLKSKTRTIETQVDTTRGQISRLNHVTGKFVGFSAELRSEKTDYNKETVIKFDIVYTNVGSNYSPSTFTVPLSGVYVFMFNVQIAYDSSDKERRAHVELCVNGYGKTEAIVQGWGSNLTGGNAAVVDVRAGDIVYVRTSSLHDRYYIWPYRTSFSGALLHVN